jgi:hypothetical protein
MTHPLREQRAREIALAHPGLNLTVVTDPDPDGTPSAWRTARRAWASIAEGATHHLVLQDDVVLAPDFTDRVLAAIASRPTDPLCLFAEWGSRTAGATRVAALHGRSWVPVVDDYIPCQALVLPVELAAGFDDFAAAESTEADPDDVVLLEYLVRRGAQALAAVVNLVDHDAVESLVGNTIMGVRRSVSFGAPARPVDSSVLTGLDAVPYYCWWEQQAVMYVPDASTLDGWGRIRSAAAFARWGVAPAEPLAALDSALARLPHAELLLDRVSSIVVTEVWRTAYLVGLVAQGLPGSVDEAALADPVAAAALATLAPGGTRRVVPPQWSAAVADLIAPLVVDAVRAGAARAREADPVLPSPARSAVASLS